MSDDNKTPDDDDTGRDEPDRDEPDRDDTGGEGMGGEDSGDGGSGQGGAPDENGVPGWGSSDKRRSRRSGPVTKGGDARAAKQMFERVKTARGRKSSSTRWLQRQLNDPYVKKAQMEGYRSRAAYKLLQLDERFKLLRPGMRVVDLGSAPGGWVQVALKAGASEVVGIDLLEMEAIAGATLLEKDFTDDDAPRLVKAEMGGSADAVISDLAPWTTGHKSTDHTRIVALAELAAHFAVETLKPGGFFIAKVFQGGSDGTLLNFLRANFEKVRHFKPDASRSESAETFVVAMAFKG